MDSKVDVLGEVQGEANKWRHDHGTVESTELTCALGVVEETGEFAASFLHHASWRAPLSLDDKSTAILTAMAWLGRIAHCELKRVQGIRYTAAELASEEVDAIGALSQAVQTILMGFGDESRQMMAEIWEGTPCKDGPTLPRTSDPPEAELADIMIFAVGWAQAANMPLSAVLAMRWEQVKQRDWNHNPIANGGGNGED